MKKILSLILLVGFIFSGTSKSQEKYKINKEDFYPFSVWYSGGKERATMLSEITSNSREEWKRDIMQIKSLGFNSIKTWVEWSHCEPRKGEYNFENLKMVLDLANEAGLKVIIQVYGESAPDWVGKEFPDGLFEAQNGDRIEPQVAPGYCIDHQGVKEAFVNFYREAARIAVQYPCFYGWDLWSEPHIVQWGSPRWIQDAQYCFCPNTQERFRQWLKAKYPSLEDLNKTWYRNFEKWEDVEAPRFGTILTYTDFMDWKSFIYQKMAEDLKLRYDAVRTYDKTHVATSHASPVSLFSSPYGTGAEDDFLMSEQVDYYGLSQYPKHNQPGDWVPWRFMTGADFSFSANKKNGGYYVGEFQAGFGTVGLNISDPVTPADHRIWVLSCLATGAKGIFTYAYYPMSSGYESGGYGLVNLDGSLTERAVELGKLAKKIDNHGILLSKAKPIKPQIALLYNPLSQMVGGTRRVGTQDGHTNSLIGYYRFLSDQNIPVDFIHRQDLESGDLSQYKLIIVPYALMFNRKAAEGLKEFVRNGGYVLSEARLAWNDERGYSSAVIPGLGLSEVFGVRESRVKTLPKVPMKLVDQTHPSMAYLKNNDILIGSRFAESLTPLNKNARVLATLEDGSPCIITSDFGKGHTIFVGSFLAMANSRGSLWDQSTQRLTVQDSANQNVNEFLLGLVDWAKIERPFNVIQEGKADNPLVVRLQEYPEGHLLFILNHGKTNEKATIKMKVKEEGPYLLEELFQNKKISINSQKGEISLTTGYISIKNGEVWKIEKVKK
jgi:beta-galactosidase